MTITQEVNIQHCHDCPYYIKEMESWTCLHPSWTKDDFNDRKSMNPDECKLENNDVIIKYKKVKQ